MRLARPLRLALVVFALLAATACHRRAPLDAEVAALAAAGKFSGVVLVERRGRIELRRAYGLADREHDVPLSLTAKLRIGSITKSLTAAAVLRFAGRGALALDAPLGGVLRDCPPAWRDITIDQLLRHTSGIPDFVRLPGFWQASTQPTTLADTVARIAKEPLAWPPGTRFQYGNSGYVVAARLLEQLSGRAYADVLRDEVFTPLGMHDSDTDDMRTVVPGHARGYVTRDGRIENAPYIDTSVALGAGSAYSTVDDLRRFVAELRHPRVLPPALVQRMLTPGLEDYGYGWYIETHDGRRVVSHIGDINGFGAFVAWLPDEETTVIVLSNLERAPVRDLAWKLLSLAIRP